jgi:hypothetical protein
MLSIKVAKRKEVAAAATSYIRTQTQVELAS